MLTTSIFHARNAALQGRREMKAIVIQGAFGLDSLMQVDLPDPVPKRDEVVIRMRAASLNYRDLMVVTGTYNPRQPLPLVPFSDGVGEVVAVGPEVTRVKIGDRVCPIFAQAWLEGEVTMAKLKTTLGSPLPGVLSELFITRETGVVKPPSFLTDAEAATLPCAGLTAYNALLGTGTLSAGDTVLVQGTGGVSIFALQFAKMVGARAIVTSSSDAKLERAKTLGAWETINYKTTVDWDKRAVELTDRIGVDHVVEVGGAGTLMRSMKAVRVAGTISVIGALAGASQDMNVLPVLMRHLRLQGIIVGSRTMFEAMNRAIEATGLRPIVDEKSFAFTDAREAITYMASGGHFGKITLHF
jgi:NADPH:quinone reductase-like Zn-dependent oxidoreductase